MHLAIFITALFLFASGVTLGVYDKVGAATATYAAAVLSLIFAFLPEFKKFKGLGIEAELLDKKIEEADKLLTQLRDIASPISEMLFSTTARMGRMGSSMPRHQKYELQQRIEKELRKCGLTDLQLERAKVDWNFYNIFDLCSPVFEKVSEVQKFHIKKINERLSSLKSMKNLESSEEYKSLIEKHDTAKSECEEFRNLRQVRDKSTITMQIRKGISNSKIISEQSKKELLSNINDELSDIEFYLKNGEFRRLPEWLSGE